MVTFDGIVPFTDALVGQFAQTYTCEPGGEFGWVTDTEYFDDYDDTVTVKRQTWMLVGEDTVTFHSSTELCKVCQGEGVTEPDDPQHPDHGKCPRCGGDGRDPLAGQQEIVPINRWENADG